MKVDYTSLSLSPYPGRIFLFKRLDHMRAKYTAMTGKPYEFADETTGGRYIRVEGKLYRDNIWLIYARRPHVLAHELSHVILQTFDRCGFNPADGNGEPFCYLLSQLMLDAKL